MPTQKQCSKLVRRQSHFATGNWAFARMWRCPGTIFCALVAAVAGDGKEGQSRVLAAAARGIAFAAAAEPFVAATGSPASAVNVELLALLLQLQQDQ